MRTTESNQAVLVTAARLRFGMTLKGSVWAAARDGGRWPRQKQQGAGEVKNLEKCIEGLRQQLERLRDAEAFIQKSFDNATHK